MIDLAINTESDSNRIKLHSQSGIRTQENQMMDLGGGELTCSEEVMTGYPGCERVSVNDQPMLAVCNSLVTDR